MKFVTRIITYITSLIFMIPLVWVIMTAFKFKDEALKLTISHGFTLDNFKNVFALAPFQIYYLNTLMIVSGIFIIQILTSTGAAYAFARLNFKGRDIIFIIMLIQLIIPNDVLIFPNYLTIRNLGLVDNKLAIMIPFFGSAFGIFLLRQTFKTIPREFEESARIDGCGTLRILRNIYMPLSRPSYIAFGLISVSYHWNNLLWPLIVTNSQVNRPLTVGLALFAMTYETGAQWAEVSAATLIVITPLVLGFYIFQKQFINSFIQSGLK